MDISAEGPLVDAGLLFKALNCHGINVLLDRRSDVPISIFETNGDIHPELKLASIHM